MGPVRQRVEEWRHPGPLPGAEEGGGRWGSPKASPPYPGGSHNPLCCTWLHNFGGECWYKDLPFYGCWGVGCTARSPTPSLLSAPCGMVTLTFAIMASLGDHVPLPQGCWFLASQHWDMVGRCCGGFPPPNSVPAWWGPCPVPAQFPQSQTSRDARSQAQPPWCLLTAITFLATLSPAPKAPPSWSILSQADPMETTRYQGRWAGGPEHHPVERAGGGWQQIISGLEVTHHCVYFFFLK